MIGLIRHKKCAAASELRCWQSIVRHPIVQIGLRLDACINLSSLAIESRYCGTLKHNLRF